MTHTLRPEGLDFLATAPRRWRFETVVGAPRPAVFAAISADPSTWTWFPGFSRGHYEGQGPLGVGSVREIRIIGVTYRETILAWDQSARWAYRVDRCSVAMAKALVEEWVTEEGQGGTVVRWTMAVDPALLFRLGLPLAPLIMGRLFRRAMANLDAELGRSPAPAAANRSRAGTEPPARPGSEMTLVEALQSLRGEGFGGEYRVVVADGAKIRCGGCGMVIDPAGAEVMRLFRLEGESDPAEEVFVAGIRCPGCAEHGTLVATYGPMADGADADVVAALADRRPR